MKEWLIENDGLYVVDVEFYKELVKYFESDSLVCVKIIN